MKSPAVIVLALSLLSGACGRLTDVDYSEFVDIPASGIPQNWEYDFFPGSVDSIRDHTARNDALIVVRYSGQCQSRSVILNVEEMSFSHETPDSSVVEIRLFNDDGKPLGKGVYGVYELSDTLRKGYIIPDGYSVSLNSPLPAGKTSGIKSIGVVVKNHSDNGNPVLKWL